MTTLESVGLHSGIEQLDGRGVRMIVKALDVLVNMTAVGFLHGVQRQVFV